MTTEKKIVIIGGNARSGTTTLTRLLNTHPDFAIGMEQFHRGWDQKRMTRAAFSEEGLTQFNPDLSTQASKDRMAKYNMTVKKYRAAKWVGDKIPLLYKTYDNIDAEMPEAEILFIVRNPLSVIESYNRRLLDPNDKWQNTPLEAIEDWNLNVSKALERIDAGKPFRVLSFEKAFATREAISRIYAIFGSSIADANERYIAATITQFWEAQSKESPKNEIFRRLVSEKCAFGIYQTLVREHCIFADLPLLEVDPGA